MFIIVVALLFCCNNILYALDSLTVQITDSLLVDDTFQVDTLPDSLAQALDSMEYDKAYSFVLELNKRDTLASATLYNCADCLVYLGKYDECLTFYNRANEMRKNSKRNVITNYKQACQEITKNGSVLTLEFSRNDPLFKGQIKPDFCSSSLLKISSVLA